MFRGMFPALFPTFMPIGPPLSEPSLSYSALDLITDALIEVGMVSPGESPDGETSQWAFRKLNYLTDVWAAKKAYVWTTSFQLFTLIPNHSPHTIGPSTADFTVSQRPVRIESAALILASSGTSVDLPINIRDDAWWAAQQVKGVKTNIPTDLFYSEDWPNGQLFFWPVPNAADQVRLQFWTTLSQYSQINDALAGPGGAGTLPPAYRAALMLTLAETLLPSGQLEAHPVLIAAAKEARFAVFGNNARSPRTQTQDSGMPRAGRRADFNWMSGNRPGGPPE